jgi:hypothetical protein
MAFVQDADDFPPQSRTLAFQASTTARDGQILARPPSGNDSPFGNKSNCSEIIATHLGYVIKLGCVREVPCAYSGCRFVDLYGGDSGNPGTFKGQRETPDPVEQGHQRQITHLPSHKKSQRYGAARRTPTPGQCWDFGKPSTGLHVGNPPRRSRSQWVLGLSLHGRPKIRSSATVPPSPHLFPLFGYAIVVIGFPVVNEPVDECGDARHDQSQPELAQRLKNPERRIQAADNERDD